MIKSQNRNFFLIFILSRFDTYEEFSKLLAPFLFGPMFALNKRCNASITRQTRSNLEFCIYVDCLTVFLAPRVHGGN